MEPSSTDPVALMNAIPPSIGRLKELSRSFHKYGYVFIAVSMIDSERKGEFTTRFAGGAEVTEGTFF
jgi:hypothetical protein